MSTWQRFDAADSISVGDSIERHGKWHTVKKVKIGRSGNVEVDYIDGSIEDLDPSAYMTIRWTD